MVELRPFPVIPPEARTGLLLFGAYFKGWNDGGHFRNAGLVSTVVDINPTLLAAMQEEYPSTWEFVEADAFQFAEDAAALGKTWDVVSVDPSAPQAARVFDMIETFGALGTMMTTVGARHSSVCPAGWVEFTPRCWSDGEEWSWLVKS